MKPIVGHLGHELGVEAAVAVVVARAGRDLVVGEVARRVAHQSLLVCELEVDHAPRGFFTIRVRRAAWRRRRAGSPRRIGARRSSESPASSTSFALVSSTSRVWAESMASMSAQSRVRSKIALKTASSTGPRTGISRAGEGDRAAVPGRVGVHGRRSRRRGRPASRPTTAGSGPSRAIVASAPVGWATPSGSASSARRRVVGRARSRFTSMSLVPRRVERPAGERDRAADRRESIATGRQASWIATSRSGEVHRPLASWAGGGRSSVRRWPGGQRRRQLDHLGQAAPARCRGRRRPGCGRVRVAVRRRQARSPRGREHPARGSRRTGPRCRAR